MISRWKKTRVAKSDYYTGPGSVGKISIVCPGDAPAGKRRRGAHNNSPGEMPPEKREFPVCGRVDKGLSLQRRKRGSNNTKTGGMR